ncbi:MAG: guanylate kinase [Chloroflexota bacterium]
MSQETNMLSDRQPLLIVISGASGSGKDTVVRRLKERQVPFHFVVTATTRPPRPSERDGVDYYFISRQRFEEMIANDELIEYAVVYKDLKGIPKEQVRQALASGKDVIMRIDVQGSATIRGKSQEAVLIFITASEEELIQRLKARGTEKPADFQVRVETMRRELASIPEFDYVVANHDGRLDEAVDKILCIIAAEHNRVNQRKVNL